MSNVGRADPRQRLLEIQRSEGVGFSDFVVGGPVALAGIVAIDVLSGPSDNWYRALMRSAD